MRIVKPNANEWRRKFDPSHDHHMCLGIFILGLGLDGAEVQTG